jgi:hypothetical protein
MQGKSFFNEDISIEHQQINKYCCGSYAQDYTHGNNCAPRVATNHSTSFASSSAHLCNTETNDSTEDPESEIIFEDISEHKEWDLFGDDVQNDDDQSNNEAKDIIEHGSNEANDNIEHLSQEDILMFLENESVIAAETASQEVRSHHTPQINQSFESENAAFAFYNEYASICGFSVKKAGNYHGKNNGKSNVTRYTFTCNRGGKVVDDEVLEKRRKQKQLRKQEKKGNQEVQQPPKTRAKRQNIIQK